MREILRFRQILVLAGLAFLGHTRLAAADTPYCAFEVRVVTPSGSPAVNVAVALVQHGSALAETLTNSAGIVRFCDAPLDAVDISVGFAACGMVVAKQVPPGWLQTTKLSVFYDPALCREFSFPEACHILLRFKDEAGRLLAGVRLDGHVPRKPRESLISDELGRIFRSLGEGERLDVSGHKDGYNPIHISQRCSLVKRDVNQELLIVLTTKP